MDKIRGFKWVRVITTTFERGDIVQSISTTCSSDKTDGIEAELLNHEVEIFKCQNEGGIKIKTIIMYLDSDGQISVNVLRIY